MRYRWEPATDHRRIRTDRNCRTIPYRGWKSTGWVTATWTMSWSWHGLATVVSTGPRDYDAAGGRYRTCRRGGERVRKLIDCLIGAVAIREGAPVLHADSDFDVLARYTALEVA